MPSTTTGSDRHWIAGAATATAPSAPAHGRSKPPGAPGVDAAEPSSVSFRPDGGASARGDARPDASARSGHEGHAFVAVGPGLPGAILLGAPGGLFGMNPLPITPAKIHRPLLRADILSRERLNGWLEMATTGRVALIVAEAGFGKTTLLGDWARHTQRRTAWYRLESDDRDWLTFVRHLVASGRELDPEFAPDTYEMLRQLGPGGPTQQELVAGVVRELAAFAAAHPEGLTLIFDDYHVVDRCEETEPIVRAILERTGPGFSLVIASRTTPKLPLGRLRARGGVARLDGDALCFDVPEADRLFRDAYHQPLDADVLATLIDRTEGWPALLGLVHANLEETGAKDPRSLVTELSTARGDLYDYLAEEVVETLPPDLRQFLMRVSILDCVDELHASAADDRDKTAIRSLIAEAEELGLIGRPDPNSPHRFHPLVRDFLRVRLGDSLGREGLAELHRRVAARFEAVDWRSAVSHYLLGGDVASVERIVDASLESVLASGSLDSVRTLLDGSAGDPNRPAALLLRSRLELGRGDVHRAVDLARAASSAASDSQLAGPSLLNLATVLGVSGFPDEAMGYAAEALKHGLTPGQRDVAVATVSMWEAGHEGDLSIIADALRELAGRQDRGGQLRYASITRLNLASLLYWLGNIGSSLEQSELAEAGLRACGAPDIELGAALAARATATAFLTGAEHAALVLEEATSSHSVLARAEAAIEMAKISADFGSASDGDKWLEQVGPSTLDGGLIGSWALIRGQLELRRGNLDRAAAMVASLAESPCRDTAGALRAQLLAARVSLAAGSTTAPHDAARLASIAGLQRSRLGTLLADILLKVARSDALGPEISQLMPHEGAVLSMLAEEISQHTHLLSADARARVESEVRARPDRWVSALRLAVRQSPGARLDAAAILSGIGTRDDVAVLRSLVGTTKAARPLAVALVRRLAPNVLVSDLGAVEVFVGGRPLDRALRRRVLALLCFLVSRPNMAATRDEALEALWPDLGPDTAVNSLHQTIYFLRRVFEPDYREGLGAGYVVFDGEVVSLDQDLVDSNSRRCWRLLSGAWRSGPDVVDGLLAAYTGRFALDFAYEDWAADYRDTLHAAVLGAAERAIGTSVESGDFDRAIELAQGVLSLDPSADSI
jgi:tetratricopeptide (TPR) repeat protein